jgi:hypothetical protein
MTNTARTALASLLAGAGTIALAAAAQAQDDDFAQECVDLFAYVEDTPSIVLDEEPVLIAVIEDNDGEACGRQLALLERQNRAEGATPRVATPTRATPPRTAVAPVVAEEDDREELEPFVPRDTRAVAQPQPQTRAQRRTATETRAVQEQVQIEETVTVVGDVDVAVGVPTVRVQQDAPTVAVATDPAEVTVDHEGPTIVVRESPARVRLEMPTITIEQDAPEIIVTMPEVGVSVASAEPRVEVRMAEPRVTVAVPEPRVDLDLRAVAGATADEVRTRITEAEEATPRAGAGERLVASRAQGGQANVLVTEAGEPRVQRTGGDAEPRVSVNRGEPTIRFEAAEAEVEVVGEPRVEYRRVGEPRVTINEAAAEPTPRRGLLARATGDDADRAAVRPMTGGMLVTDLVGREVIGQEGEELGEITRFVRSGNSVYAVLERGGFLGFGEDEIPLPVRILSMRGEELVATTLTEEEVEQLEDQDISDRLNLRDDDSVMLGR